MRSFVKRSGVVLAVGVVSGLVAVGTPAGAQEGSQVPTGFDPVTRYTVSGSVAEIVSATPDGETLVGATSWRSTA